MRVDYMLAQLLPGLSHLPHVIWISSQHLLGLIRSVNWAPDRPLRDSPGCFRHVINNVDCGQTEEMLVPTEQITNGKRS